MKTTFAGRSALVTGGGSGSGRALARRLVALGARGRRCGPRRGRRRTPPVTTSPHRRRRRRHRRRSPSSSTSRRATPSAQLVADVVERHGRLDLLFNNAGISMGGPTHELTGAHWDRIIDVNLRGVVNGVLAAYPTMVEQGHGHIVNTASGAGLVAPPFVTAYADDQARRRRPSAPACGPKPPCTVSPSARCAPARSRRRSSTAPRHDLPTHRVPTGHRPPVPRRRRAAADPPTTSPAGPSTPSPQPGDHRRAPSSRRRSGTCTDSHRRSPADSPPLARRVDRQLVRPATSGASDDGTSTWTDQ